MCHRSTAPWPDNAPMSPRRPFHRAGEGARRAALIEATLDLIAEGGPEAATVRAIAEHAGVTPGLIRHYFATKEDLVAAAHEALMSSLTAAAAARLDDLPDDPRARLAGFVAASVSPPVTGPRAMALWAAAMQLVPRDPVMRRVHEATYLDFRDRLEGLIADALRAAGRAVHPPTIRAHAIAGNALIDGLWLEASALPEHFSETDLPALALSAFSRLLDLPLED
jgi:TetR/AcrR family transcriptional regulator, transcriptional repressor of bet genes